MKDPQQRYDLFGHAKKEALYWQAHANKRMPHAWLLTGPKGVGKATLAYRLARTWLYLGEENANRHIAPLEWHHTQEVSLHRASLMVAQGAHPDLYVLERQINTRSGKLQQKITIDQVRDVAKRLQNTSGRSSYRVLLIDTADDLNKNSANALLKLIEEPTTGLQILILCHSTARIPSTIISRCARLKLNSLDDIEIKRFITSCSSIPSENQQALALLSEGVPGNVVDYWENNFLEAYKDFLNDFQLDLRMTVSGQFPVPSFSQENHRTVFQLLELICRRLVLYITEKNSFRAVFNGEAQIMEALFLKYPLDHWLSMWKKALHAPAEIEAVNLDAKSLIALTYQELLGGNLRAG